jgi:polysaccharide biosynthesis/export protein
LFGRKHPLCPGPGQARACRLDHTTTAIQGVAMAGGFTELAAPNRRKVIRTHVDGRKETIVADLNEVVKRGRPEKDPPLMLNDVVVIPESFF